MSNVTKRPFYAYLSEVAWRMIALAYGRAPDSISALETGCNTYSSVLDAHVFINLVRNNLITGNPEAFAITEKGQALYEGGYIYYHHLYPGVPFTKPPFFKEIAAVSFYGIYRLDLYVNAIRKNLLNCNQRRQRRIKYKEAQAALAQIAAWPSNFDDGLHHIATVIQKHLAINVVAIFITDPTAEWAVFRTGVVKGPKGEEAVRILQERESKIYLRSKIWLMDYLGHSQYQSDPVSSRSQLLSMRRLPIRTTFRFGSPLFGDTGSFIHIPLWTDQKQIGTLELDTFNTQASFREDELSTLLPLVDQVTQICKRCLNSAQPSGQRQHQQHAQQN